MRCIKKFCKFTALRNQFSISAIFAKSVAIRFSEWAAHRILRMCGNFL